MLIKKENKYQVVVGAPIMKSLSKEPANQALNIQGKGFPAPSASINSMPDTALFQAIDGRIWYFPEITNRWTTKGSSVVNDWYAIDFGETHELSTVKLYLFADEKTFAVPDAITIEYQKEGKWIPVKRKLQNADNLIGNTVNTITFNKINANGIRVNFRHSKLQVAVTELECY